MNDPMTAAVLPLGNELAFWSRFRVTFGPALVGLIGGTLTVGIAWSMMVAVFKNIAGVYAKYPSVDAPWPARDFTLPYAVMVPMVFLAVAAPFIIGLVTARLVRPKGQWEAVSAGLTTAATASAAAYVVWIGWVVTIGMVIVPSISDMSVLAKSSRTPAEATVLPSDVLTAPYPELKATPANDRGQLFSNKIESDQAVGSVYGVWFGVIVSMAAVGLPAFCGTLAGAWLLRRGGSRWSNLVSYFELTVATAGPLVVLVYQMVRVGFAFGQPIDWLRCAALAMVSAVVVKGVIGRWGWPIRLVAAFSWALVLFGAGIGGQFTASIGYAAYAVYIGLAFLLFQKWHSAPSESYSEETELSPVSA